MRPFELGNGSIVNLDNLLYLSFGDDPKLPYRLAMDRWTTYPPWVNVSERDYYRLRLELLGDLKGTRGAAILGGLEWLDVTTSRDVQVRRTAWLYPRTGEVRFVDERTEAINKEEDTLP